MLKHSQTRIAAIIVLIVFAIGFYLRSESIWGTQVDKPIRADAKEYFIYAYNMQKHHTYSKQVDSVADPDIRPVPDAFRTPGYPIFLALSGKIEPNLRTVNKILVRQMILSFFTLIIAYFYFRKMYAPHWAAGACFMLALSPHLIVSNSYILTETLFCFLLVLVCWVYAVHDKRGSMWLLAAVGMVIGFTSLVRPSLQYFPVVLIPVFVHRHGFKKGLHHFAVIILGFALVFSPWVIRNIISVNKTSDKSLMISFLHHGMYPDFTYKDVAKSYGFPYRHDPATPEIGKDTRSILKEIVRRFREEPWRHFKWFAFKKPVTFWSWNIIQGQGDVFIYPVLQTPYETEKAFYWSHRFMYLLHWPVLLMSAIGCIFAWLKQIRPVCSEERIRIAQFTSILLVYFTLLHMVGAPFPRYSVPLRPFVYGMAFFFLGNLIGLTKYYLKKTDTALNSAAKVHS
jgi:4-amino-4-deoxy-L-arabinose transferase-like glycosyltransferase